MKNLEFSTKSKNLSQLEGFLSSAKVLPQFCFHQDDFDLQYHEFQKLSWSNEMVIVRSSSYNEDSSSQSLAGHFTSLLNIKGKENLKVSIQEVFSSYTCSSDNIVFVQPMLNSIKISGVVFTRDQSSNGPYIVINYDSESGLTNTVTDGSTNSTNLRYIYKNDYSKCKNDLISSKILPLTSELENIFNCGSLDIEFALTCDNEIFLLQVRPLVINQKSPLLSSNIFHQNLINIRNKVKNLFSKHPYLSGRTNLLGVMPDWNPAEIIGFKPSPLSLSLYKELITDNIWAYQRSNYGYRNLRSFPLLVDLGGIPFIDVRVSFNSFVPFDIDTEIADKLVDYYITKLASEQHHHDKVEFNIVYSCYYIGLISDLNKLLDSGFTKAEIDSLYHSLLALTNNIISDEGLWFSDLIKIKELEDRYLTISNSQMNLDDKIYWLIQDCKRYGTLPFAGLARAGFIAVQLLNSLQNEGLLTLQEVNDFMSSLNTISNSLNNDIACLNKDEFLKKYGHLRPGTYDIMSLRYDDPQAKYFDWENLPNVNETNHFVLPSEKMVKIDNVLKNEKISHNAESLFRFIKKSIEGREYSKYLFTKSLSLILELIQQYGFSKEDCSFIDINTLIHNQSSSRNSKELIKQSIRENKESFNFTKLINLPPLITSPDDVYDFDLPVVHPNYITQGCVRGKVETTLDGRAKLKDAIVFISNADPGFDWIFTCGIKGFITMFGGANSHMAIRSSELGIPAVIGCGELLFKKWSKYNYLELNCLQKVVIEIS